MNKSYTYVAFFALLLASCGGKQQNNNAAPQAKAYNVATLQPGPVTLFNIYPAVIQGRKVVEIRPKIEGFVEKIYVDEGATVKKGQLLFRIFNPQYEETLRSAEAGIKTAEAELATAQMTVNKVRPLVEKDIISKFELQSAEYTLASKQAALTSAKAAVANARTNLAYTTISSPMNGIIGLFPNREGSYINSTTAQPLTTISSSGDMFAYFSINEKKLLELTTMMEGGTLQKKLKNFPAVELLLPDGSLFAEKGRVETASGQVTTETGSVSFRATFPDPSYILRSGNSGNIRMPRTIDDALIIPQSATYDLQGKRFVFVVASDSTVKSTAIDVTATPDGQSFVVNSGLKAGDVIALQGTNELKDGVKIIPKHN